MFSDLIAYPLSLDDLKKSKLAEGMKHAQDSLMSMFGMHGGTQSDGPIDPKLEMEIKDLSQIKANITFNPNRDIVEDRPKQKEYSR